MRFEMQDFSVLKIVTSRAVASLTVPGGQDYTFLIFSSKFRSVFLIFPQTFLIFFLIFPLRVGDSPTQKGPRLPGYATGYKYFANNVHFWFDTQTFQNEGSSRGALARGADRDSKRRLSIDPCATDTYDSFGSVQEFN